ncbi:MAG: energy transducer TonB [Gammaproteobacteria bacterium]|nr:energy transducer TonB [Gammaproteobacteria bacterium]
MSRQAMWTTSGLPIPLVLTALACLVAPTIVADDTEEPQPVDIERKPSFTMMPDYPKIARRDRIEGEVQVCFDITRDGRTRRIAVRRSTNRLFEKPAIRAVRASSYVPLPDDAVVSGIKACRTFRFTLEPTVVETGS